MRTHFKRFILAPIVALATVFMFSGCASMFSARYQRVNFITQTPGTEIELYTKEDVTTSKRAKLDKTKVFYTARVEKEGYKSTNYAFQLNKRAGSFALTALNIPIVFYGWFYGIPYDILSPKTFKFDSDQVIPDLLQYENRMDNEKYMLINKTDINAKGEDLTFHTYGSIDKFRAGDNKDNRKIRKSNESKSKEDIKVDNTFFTEALNETLKDMNFVDTTHTIFPNHDNSLYLNATINKITVHYVTPNFKQHHAFQTNDLMSIELSIDWQVLDYYKQPLYSTTTVKKSDLFVLKYDYNTSEFNSVLIRAMEDNLNYALIDIRDEISEKGYLKMAPEVEKNYPDFVIPKPQVAPDSRLTDFLKSSVIVKVEDGHGSGVIISEEGHIVTAYHVVAGAKKIQVIMDDGAKVDADVIRISKQADLALLKVNRRNLVPLPLVDSKDIEIGIDVWAMGTPKTLELGQTVTRGILSSHRLANSVQYLQTDVSVNSGNSGGALISRNGDVLGIVTSKLAGVGTEGLGFAISSYEIFRRLSIGYKE